MRKVCLILLVVVLLLTASMPLAATAETVTPYEYATAFASAFPERSSLGGEEPLSAETLVTFLETIGYDVKTQENIHQYTSLNTATTFSCKYKHVLGFKDNGKGRKVVIGAYYGGYEADQGTDAGQGVEVALSVGALQYIAAALYQDFTEYDLVVAFWGGVELSAFDIEKCGVDPATVVLYVNLDGVAAGTNDYFYCDDVPRSHSDLFKKAIEASGANIQEPPAYKRTTLLTGAGGAYSTSHLGLFGVNAFFLNEDVPCVSFLSGAWTYDAGVYRYEGKKDVVGTSDDTFEVIDRRNGGREATEKRLLAVSDVIITALRDDGLSATLDAATKDISGADLDSSLAYYLITFIGAGVIIALFILLIVRQGKDRREEVWEDRSEGADEQETEAPSTYKSPFSEFDPNDGSSDDEDRDGGGDGGNDVFRF